jgi:hypothetical protein
MAGTNSGRESIHWQKGSMIKVERSLWPLALLMILTALGCSDDNPLDRRAIQGTVTFRGQPLKHGSIQFSPDDMQRGVGSGAVITDGSFEIPEAQGLPPGKYKVVISAAESASAAPSNEAPGAPGQLAVELIPAEWNVDAKHSVEIKSDVDAQVNFDIK